MSDTTDDMEIYSSLLEDYLEISPLDYWKLGSHKTKNGEIIKIKDMKTSHLENTIKYFKNLDTSILRLELLSRIHNI